MYIYDEYYDCIICPNNQPLKYSTTNKEGYKEYKSDPAICSKCAMREKCTQSKNCQKVVTRHVWAEYMEKAEDYRHTPQYKKSMQSASKRLRESLRVLKSNMVCGIHILED